MCDAYLEGMSFQNAAAKAGINIAHSQARRVLHNKKYLGTDFYPALMDGETHDRVVAETKKRAEKLGRIYPQKELPSIRIHKKFRMGQTNMKYSDPFKQAEYIYQHIKEADEGG